MDENETPAVDPRDIAVPKSLLFLLLAIPAFLIQLVPILGIVTMMLGSPAWPAFCLYAAAIGTLVEWNGGKILPGWLLLFAVPLGGYEAYAAVQHMAAYRMDAELDAQNAKARMPFDSTKQNLVLLGDRTGYDTTDDDARWIVANNVIPVVYIDFGTKVEAGRSRYISWRTSPKAGCGYRNTEVFTSNINDGPRGRPQEEGCFVGLDEAPRGGILTVATVRTRSVRSGMGVTTATSTLSSGSSRAIVRTGTVKPVSWFPFFFAGCGLDSSTPAWRCGSSINRDTVTLGIDDPKETMRPVAKALGLEWTGWEKRRIPSDPNVLSILADWRRIRTDGASDRILSQLRSKAPEFSGDDLMTIGNDPDSLKVLAPRLIAWTKAGLERRIADRRPECHRNQVGPQQNTCDVPADIERVYEFLNERYRSEMGSGAGQMDELTRIHDRAWAIASEDRDKAANKAEGRSKSETEESYRLRGMHQKVLNDIAQALKTPPPLDEKELKRLYEVQTVIEKRMMEIGRSKASDDVQDEFVRGLMKKGVAIDRERP